MVCEVQGFQDSPLVGFVEWKAIAGIIDIVRSAAGRQVNAVAPAQGCGSDASRRSTVSHGLPEAVRRWVT